LELLKAVTVPKPEEAYDPQILGAYFGRTDSHGDRHGKGNGWFCQGICQIMMCRFFRPGVIKDCNQIFSRDIAFVIDNQLVKANILPR